MESPNHDALASTYAAIIAEARAEIAAGRDPDAARLAERIRAAGSTAGGGHEAEQTALRRLESVIAVHRAKMRLESEPAPTPPVPAPPSTPRRSLRAALRSRPTITGNMEVRRSEEDETLMLGWDPASGISEWEVRFAERPSPGEDYAPLETLTLPPETTTVAVPLGEKAFRINIVGRSRDGRPRSRTVIAGLTRSSWGERWERRATAS